jgi:hypothetical protein
MATVSEYKRRSEARGPFTEVSDRFGYVEPTHADRAESGKVPSGDEGRRQDMP